VYHQPGLYQLLKVAFAGGSRVNDPDGHGFADVRRYSDAESFTGSSNALPMRFVTSGSNEPSYDFNNESIADTINCSLRGRPCFKVQENLKTVVCQILKGEVTLSERGMFAHHTITGILTPASITDQSNDLPSCRRTPPPIAGRGLWFHASACA
jgi:hypothetical protein